MMQNSPIQPRFSSQFRVPLIGLGANITERQKLADEIATKLQEQLADKLDPLPQTPPVVTQVLRKLVNSLDRPMGNASMDSVKDLAKSLPGKVRQVPTGLKKAWDNKGKVVPPVVDTAKNLSQTPKSAFNWIKGKFQSDTNSNVANEPITTPLVVKVHPQGAAMEILCGDFDDSLVASQAYSLINATYDQQKKGGTPLLRRPLFPLIKVKSEILTQPDFNLAKAELEKRFPAKSAEAETTPPAEKDEG